MILSETMTRFVTDNFLYNLNLLFFPIGIFIVFYITLIILLKSNIGAKT